MGPVATHVVCSWSWFKDGGLFAGVTFWYFSVADVQVPDDEDSVPDDLPVLPEEIYLMIAREYRLATAEDRAINGWHRVHLEMRYLPRCPKRKRLINLKGFMFLAMATSWSPCRGTFTED